MTAPADVLSAREFGVLLHITSLPGDAGGGDLGSEAYRFIDFLSAGGAAVWQVLPLVTTHACGSPYNGQSVHAGNPLLTSVRQLHQEGLVSDELLQAYLGRLSDGMAPSAAYRILLTAIGNCFRRQPGNDEKIRRFQKDNDFWLPDYALFRVLKGMHRQAPWHQWPAALRERDAGALAQVRHDRAEEIELEVLAQYLFWRQWAKLKRYANNHGIRVMGDMPMYPAYDSAEVWSAPHCFQLDPRGLMLNVAGVPPDYFSPTGQRWGNPLYDWQRMSDDGFSWWLERIRLQLSHFDLVRLDHFRGFESYWSIPASSEDATQGRWIDAPGDDLFTALDRTGLSGQLIAEDLGLLTPSVGDLRRRAGLPGMRVLQFAFDGDSGNLHLPHNHEPTGVVYTGTHDNQTTLGWFDDLDPGLQQSVYGYLGMPQEPMPWALIRTAMASVCRLAMIPMQDVMALGDCSRMNTPGTEEGNWRWRFQWSEVHAELPHRLRHLASIYGRLR